jgi:cell division protein FtsB
MRELQQKQRMKRRLYSTPALILLAFITFLFVRGTYVVLEKKSESARSVELLNEKAIALRQKQVELADNIEALKTSEGIEREVKEKYNVAKEGERVVILVDREATTTDNTAVSKPWWQKAWSAIMSAL